LNEFEAGSNCDELDFDLEDAIAALDNMMMHVPLVEVNEGDVSNEVTTLTVDSSK
jgi:hypothetical protein